MSVLSDAPKPETVSTGAFGAAGLFLASMLAGSALGLYAPEAAERASGFTDTTLLILISLIFFELRLSNVARAFGNFKFLTLAWIANFLIVPAIGFAIASLLFSGQPLLFAGIMIYFLAPCTDWFLGFTRMAHGNTELGAALIPINMVSQLLLFPLWLWFFTPATGLVDFGAMPVLLVQWFLLPMALAQGLRFALNWALPEATFEALMDQASRFTTLALALLIALLFASHVKAILGNAGVFALVALAVMLFFALTFLVGRAIASSAQLPYPNQALLAMTMAARNAPLMLALTAVAIPDQPLVLAVIVFGMLVEIPHLTLLRQLLLRQSRPSHKVEV
ncbi:MAG: arsenic resistance protein [Pseudomonadota bacterium]